jgi:hypothetical protein
VANKSNEAVVSASFALLHIITKQSKPLMDGDLVKECRGNRKALKNSNFLKLSVSLQTQ